mmetsp:Transcript_30416/g.90368  ORF Transcript_30416/g.90368 Transcript_30416/m.90368 type:complete len:233 (-) Transcript_30416:2190-2888(-)
MIRRTERGNITSRKRILYPQMMRCLSVCLWSHEGHWYCTSPYSKPSAAAIAGSEPMKAGERKFLRNQNLTCRFVRCSTDCSMILRKRSYKCPDAREKTCTVSLASPFSPPDHHLATDPITPAARSPPSPAPAPAPPAASPCLSSSSIETDSSPGRFCASSRMFAPVKSAIVTRTAAASLRVAGAVRCMPPRKARVEWPAARRAGAVRRVKTSEEGPGARERSHTPGAALSWK